MEQIVCRDFAKGRPADELAKDLKILEEDEQEGFWEVEGNFSTLSLGEIMMPYQKIREFCCNFPNAKYYARGGGYRNFLDDDDKAYLRFFYNADKDFRIIQLRKSEAYALQNLLNKLGAAKAKVEKQEGGLS
jgi:hypothetical protein